MSAKEGIDTDGKVKSLLPTIPRLCTLALMRNSYFPGGMFRKVTLLFSLTVYHEFSSPFSI